MAFALVSLFQTAVLSLFYARVMMRESENFALESLSKKSQTRAVEVDSLLKQKLSLQEIKARGYTLVTHTGETNSSAGFRAADLVSILPKNGAVVTSCETSQHITYYCALSGLSDGSLWALEIAPRLSVIAVLKSLANQLLLMAALTLIAALAIAYVLSTILLHPLEKFSRAAKEVARGHYAESELPTERSDEIGAFARAFQRMILDIKERERNIALSSMKLSHASRLASLGQMGASIAHEVKNPLTSMIGYARVLKDKLSEPQLQEAAEIIQNEGERCNQILQQMLRFARQEGSEKRPYSLQEVLQSTLLLLKSEAKTKQIQIKNEVTEDAILMGTPQHIQQVVMNLIVNAIHASPSGASIEVNADHDLEWLKLHITDHGSGIPKNIRGRIFDPFFTTKTGTEGTGLGLSVAKEMIQDQGGNLSFETEEGQGTRFTVRLPLPPTDQATGTPLRQSTVT